MTESVVQPSPEPPGMLFDPAALREWAGRIGARYLDVDETDRLAELNGGPGNLLVRVIPTHIVTE